MYCPRVRQMMLRNGGETNQELGDSGDRLEKVASNIFLCTQSITLHRLHPNLKINNVHALPITVIVASCFCSRSTTQGRGNTTWPQYSTLFAQPAQHGS